MVDYIHLTAPVVPEVSHLAPRFIHTRVDPETGETREYSEYIWGPLIVRVYTTHFTLRGSLHFFWNYLRNRDERNNHNQFNYHAFKKVVEYIAEKLKCSPEIMRLNGYEYGLNLIVSFDPKEFVDTHLIAHRNPPDRQLERDYDDKGRFIGFGRDRRVFKIYDKGKQAVIDENILRIENKIRKSIAHPDIKTLADLLDKRVWKKFKDQLKRGIKDLVILDKPEDHIELSNPSYWRRLKRTASPKQRMNVFNKLPYSRIKEEILEKIESTFKELIGTNAHTLAVSNVVPSKLTEEQTPTNRCALVPRKKVCPVTGYDISHQRPQSKYLSEKTISALSETEIEGLSDKYCTTAKRSLPIRKRLYYIAHNIRNKGCKYKK